MTIEVYAICYNEEALLPYFLRHYESFADRIIIYDNYSTDHSPEICAAHPKVEVRKYNTGNEIRDDIYLQIKNNCWKNSKADWVIVCDIDELVYRMNIHHALKATWATVIAPALFNMYSDEFPTTPGQIWQQVTLGVPGGAKLNLFRPDQITEINYDPGCHVAHPEGNVIIDKEEDQAFKTLHMRFLSKEWVIARNELSRQRLSKLNKEMGWGIHYHATPVEISADFDRDIKNATEII